MKLNAREALQFCKSPDRRYAAVLIYGEDGVEVSRRRALLIKALSGGGDDLALTRLDAAAARRDPAIIIDAIQSKGFFGGDPIVLIENGTDGLATGLTNILSTIRDDDAFLVVTAGILPARSKLRKLFETERGVAAVPCYLNVLGKADIQDMLTDAAITSIEDAAIQDLVNFARHSDRGALLDLITRLSLYTLSTDDMVNSHDVINCLPGAGDADLDEVLDAVADGNAQQIGPIMAKLESQGVNATTLAISAMRKFKQLHAISSAGGPADTVISRLKPPVFGPRRDTLTRQARIWTTPKCEGALKLILETDVSLRGGAAAAGYPLLERALMRLAMGAKR